MQAKASGMRLMLACLAAWACQAAMAAASIPGSASASSVGAPAASQAWTGYSDRPVPARLGPNTFRFPMNLYESQVGPDRDGARLNLAWPALEALPAGARAATGYSETWGSRSIDIDLRYMERPLLDALLPALINEGPPGRSFAAPDDPAQHRSLRIEGEPVHGLTPYYADPGKLAAYFRAHGIDASGDNLARNGDDWYLARDEAGRLRTVIVCTSRTIAGARLIGGKLQNTPPGVERGGCRQTFTVPAYGLRISVFYLRAYLVDWKRIEERISGLLERYRATPP